MKTKIREQKARSFYEKNVSWRVTYFNKFNYMIWKGNEDRFLFYENVAYASVIRYSLLLRRLSLSRMQKIYIIYQIVLRGSVYMDDTYLRFLRKVTRHLRPITRPVEYPRNSDKKKERKKEKTRWPIRNNVISYPTVVCPGKWENMTYVSVSLCVIPMILELPRYFSIFSREWSIRRIFEIGNKF